MNKLPQVYIKIIAVLLCGVMIFVSSPLSYAVDDADTSAEADDEDGDEDDDDDDSSSSKSDKDKLADAQKELQEIKSALDSANKLVGSLKSSQSDTKKRIEALQSQLEDVEDAIGDIESGIADTEEMIADTQAEIDETMEHLSSAEEDRDKQYEDMKKRIRFMYVNSDTSYLEKLLSCQGVFEFLNEIKYIESIADYDHEMMDVLAEIIDEIERTRELLDSERETLEAQKAVLEAQKAAQEENKEALQVLETARQKELSGIEEDLNDAEALAAYYEAEAKAQNEIIGQIRAAMAAKAAAGGDDASKIDDRYGFLWPCPSSTLITSDYGPRSAPTKGASTNHKGIDIGAAYGAPIVASQNGTVSVATYSASCGNYVMIDHGAGLYTVYMHASELACTAGEDVVRGDVIAYVGSTGISTGNHLHFGVSEDGEYVSPWNYVSR